MSFVLFVEQVTDSAIRLMARWRTSVAPHVDLRIGHDTHGKESAYDYLQSRSGTHAQEKVGQLKAETGPSQQKATLYMTGLSERA